MHKIILFLVTTSIFAADSFTYSISGKTMGTSYSIFVDSKSIIDIKTMKKKVEFTLSSIDDAVSTWNKKSFISKFNNSNKTIRDGSNSIFMDLFKKSLLAYEFTGGMYDPTVSLKRDKSLKSTFVESKIKNNQIIVPYPTMKLDFSAMAKGDAVDKVHSLIVREYGRNTLVEIGGEIRASGYRNGEPWGVSITNPLSGVAVDYLTLLDHSVATSGGVYKKGHIINPKTSEKASSSLLSVTILDKDCFRADYLATAVFAMGEGALEFINKHKLQAVLIQKRNKKIKILKLNLNQ